MKIGGANFEMKLCRYCRYPYLLADNTVQLKPVVYKYMGHVIKHIDVLVYEYIDRCLNIC